MTRRDLLNESEAKSTSVLDLRWADAQTVGQLEAFELVRERTVYGWLRRGKLPALKLGRLWRIRREDLEAFLEGARARAP